MCVSMWRRARHFDLPEVSGFPSPPRINFFLKCDTHSVGCMEQVLLQMDVGTSCFHRHAPGESIHVALFCSHRQ
ncbi:hypothetical protein M758_UG336100 [Ceratodon purpureus]|nr:hypothetical protein M758_UG336100 [Ceratodon purpureus]